MDQFIVVVTIILLLFLMIVVIGIVIDVFVHDDWDDEE